MTATPSAAAAEPQHALTIPRIALHFLALGLMAYFLASHLNETWPKWGYRELLLAVVVAIQAGLYLKRWFFAPLDTCAPRWWYIYFAGSLACCFAESLIARPFYWLVALYVGQMCAILAPRISIVASIVAIIGIQFTAYGPTRLAN